MRELSIKNSKRIQKAIVENKISVAKLLFIINNQIKEKLEKNESFLLVDYSQSVKELTKILNFKLLDDFNPDNFPSSIEMTGKKERIIVKKFYYLEKMTSKKIRLDMMAKGFRPATFTETLFFLIGHRRLRIKIIALGSIYFRPSDNFFIPLLKIIGNLKEIKYAWLDELIPEDCFVLGVKI